MGQRSHVHDRELLEALERIEPVAVAQRVWRVAWKTRSVIQGGTGGRWSPASGPEALYTSEEADGALAEIYHHLAIAPVFSSCDMLCYPITIQTQRTLCLDTKQAITAVGLSVENITGRKLHACQAVGAAAHMLEFDSIWVPGARWPCRNLVVFLDPMSDWQDHLETGDPEPINWAAWRERPDVSKRISRPSKVHFRY